MEELKPCPFCGGKAELYESEAYNLKTETKEKDIRWFVMCEQCTALTCGALKKKQLRHGTGGRVMGDLISRQAAIDLWEQYHPYIATKACEYDTMLRQLPSAQPSGKDPIEREAVVDILHDAMQGCSESEENLIGEIVSEVDLLPSTQRTCVNCGRTVNNGGWYADGRTRCPIEEHYALPKDGYCHLWEKRNVTDDDYPERREE